MLAGSFVVARPTVVSEGGESWRSLGEVFGVHVGLQSSWPGGKGGERMSA